MQKIIQDVQEMEEGWNILWVPESFAFKNISMVICHQCGKPEHGTTACNYDGVVIDQSCRGLQF